MSPFVANGMEWDRFPLRVSLRVIFWFFCDLLYFFAVLKKKGGVKQDPKTKFPRKQQTTTDM